MICSSCGENRNEVHSRPSKLMQGVDLFLCNKCLEEKKEPRAFIIIYGRRNGFDAVKDYIKKRRYCGDEIKASELTV